MPMLSALLLAFATAQAAAQIVVPPSGWICGRAFALRLSAQERAIARDSGTDFLTYRVTGPAGAFLIYEGNAPQPADHKIATGLQWPAVVAIHDQRRADAKSSAPLISRILKGQSIPAHCRTRPTLVEP